MEKERLTGSATVVVCDPILVLLFLCVCGFKRFAGSFSRHSPFFSVVVALRLC